MKKLLLAIVLLVGCDDAPTEHTHEGICVRMKMNSAGMRSFECYNNWVEQECLIELAQSIYHDVSWYYMTCDEFCYEASIYYCSTISDEYTGE